jgi:hypothetical protein
VESRANVERDPTLMRLARDVDLGVGAAQLVRRWDMPDATAALALWDDLELGQLDTRLARLAPAGVVSPF